MLALFLIADASKMLFAGYLNLLLPARYRLAPRSLWRLIQGQINCQGSGLLCLLRSRKKFPKLRLTTMPHEAVTLLGFDT